MHKELLGLFGPVVAELIRKILDLLLVRAGLCPECASKVRALKEGPGG